MITLLPITVGAENQEEDLTIRNVNDEIIYSILVDRYSNGTQKLSDQADLEDPHAYHGGDLKGITKELDNIRGHGFTAISLSPIVDNAKGGYHGYWVEDHYALEEEFGSEEDLKELVQKAHDKDIRVILELDVNYVAKSSPLVSEHPDWFKDVTVETNDFTDWLDEVVAFDQTNKEVQDYLIDVATYWQDQVDIDGYILHAVDQMNIDFLKTLSHEIQKNKPYNYILANTLDGDEIDEAIYEIDEIDAVTNAAIYEKMAQSFAEPNQPVSEVIETHEKYLDHKNLLYIDNMNTSRFANNAGDHGRTAETAWNIALAYLYLTPGIPVVYQGSEVPMYGPGFPEVQDMVNFTSADPDIEDIFDKMGSLRQQYKPLNYGEFEIVAEEGGMSVFKRSFNGENIFVAINNDDSSHTVKFDSLGDDQILRGLFEDDTIREDENGQYLLALSRESMDVFVVKEDAGLNWPFISFISGIMGLFLVFVITMTIKQNRRKKKQ